MSSISQTPRLPQPSPRRSLLPVAVDLAKGLRRKYPLAHPSKQPSLCCHPRSRLSRAPLRYFSLSRCLFSLFLYRLTRGSAGRLPNLPSNQQANQIQINSSSAPHRQVAVSILGLELYSVSLSHAVQSLELVSPPSLRPLYCLSGQRLARLTRVGIRGDFRQSSALPLFRSISSDPSSTPAHNISMPIKLPKAFARRKSSGNVLEEVQNTPVSSFRVFERPPTAGNSADGSESLRRTSQVPMYPSAENRPEEELFPLKKDELRNRYALFHRYPYPKRRIRKPSLFLTCICVVAEGQINRPLLRPTAPLHLLHA